MDFAKDYVAAVGRLHEQDAREVAWNAAYSPRDGDTRIDELTALVGRLSDALGKARQEIDELRVAIGQANDNFAAAIDERNEAMAALESHGICL